MRTFINRSKGRARRRRGGPPRPDGEAGFSLIELLFAVSLAVGLLGGTLAMLQSTQQVQARDTELALTLQEGRAGLSRMVREIRQASTVEEAKPNSITFLATLNGKSWKIKYDCTINQAGTTFHECVRYAVEGVTLPGTGQPMARDVLNETAADTSDPVFTYSPSSAAPGLVTARIVLPSSGTLKQAGSVGYTHKIVLEDAADIRSLNL